MYQQHLRLGTSRFPPNLPLASSQVRRSLAAQEIKKAKSTHKNKEIDSVTDRSQSTRVALVKLSLPNEELQKLTRTERKHYVMLTSILRDVIMLQKLLIFVNNSNPPCEILKSAKATQIIYFITTLGSTIHEAKRFLSKEKMLKNITSDLVESRNAVSSFFACKQTREILRFIRDKFGFHYDTKDDLDPKIDSVFVARPEIYMWLSDSDSCNDLFSSTDDVICEVIYNELQGLGFKGNIQEFIGHLFDLVLDGAEVIVEFGRAYLAKCFSAKWLRQERAIVDVPSLDDISLPLIVGRSSKNEGN